MSRQVTPTNSPSVARHVIPHPKAGPVAADRLKSFIERIEKLIEERVAIQGDIKDVFSEAKGVGYNVPIMRRVIALRAMDAADRAEQETLLDTYMHALESVDRVQARVAAGESVRAVGAAEGVPPSTVHRLSQKRAKVENGTVEAGGPGGPNVEPDTGSACHQPEGTMPVPAERSTPAQRDISTTPTVEGEGEEVPSGRDERSDENFTGAAHEQPNDRGIESRLLPEEQRCGPVGVGEGDGEVYGERSAGRTAAGRDVSALSPPLGGVPAAGASAETERTSHEVAEYDALIAPQFSATPSAAEPQIDDLAIPQFLRREKVSA